jgi:PTH1 family peptidyl-tRNA hydrolase
MTSWTLAPGIIRLKTGGGHGGHNGLRDIIPALANQNGFHRLRVGIGHPGDAKQVSNYVLGKAPASEQDMIEAALDAAEALSDDIIAGNLAAAMNKLNGFKA